MLFCAILQHTCLIECFAFPSNKFPGMKYFDFCVCGSQKSTFGIFIYTELPASPRDPLVYTFQMLRRQCIGLLCLGVRDITSPHAQTSSTEPTESSPQRASDSWLTKSYSVLGKMNLTDNLHLFFSLMRITSGFSSH